MLADAMAQKESAAEIEEHLLKQRISEAAVVNYIKSVTNEFSASSIHSAYIDVMSRKSEIPSSQEDAAHKVLELLRRGKKQTRKRAPKVSHKEMQAALESNIATDIF